jgi:hypothetical protein
MKIQIQLKARRKVKIMKRSLIVIFTLITVGAVLSACMWGGKPTMAENVTHLCGGNAQVEFDRLVTARNVAWDALRLGSPAAEIDIQKPQALMDAFCDEAMNIDAQAKLLVDIYGEAADISSFEDAMANVRDRADGFVSSQVALYDEAESALDLYKVVITLPNYNKEQKQALKACETALEKGNWTEAMKQCEKSQDAAVPPTPTRTPNANAPETLTPLTPQPPSQ